MCWEAGFRALAQGFHAGIEQRTHGGFGKILHRCLVDEAGKPRLDPLDRLANILAIREADSEIDPLGYAVGLGHPPAENALNIDLLEVGAASFDEKRHLAVVHWDLGDACRRSEEHTSELQSLMRLPYAALC